MGQRRTLLVRAEIRRAAASGIYDIRGGGSKRRLPHFDVVTSYGIYIPTGQFDIRGGKGVSSGQWSNQFSLGGAVFFGIFGNNAIYQYLTGRFDFLAVAAAQGENAAIIGGGTF